MKRNQKVVIVTGAAMGIGKGIAKELANAFGKVILADISEEEGKKSADELTSEKCNVEFVNIDLTDDRAVESLFSYVFEKYGRIDSLVCNAGIQIRHWAIDFPMEDFDKIIDLNLRAYYVCCRTCAKYMKISGMGSIVCISSVNGQQYHSKRSAYNISKAAINGLVGTLGVEWGRYNIRINAVAPGYVETEVMLSGIREGIINPDEALSIIPLKRFIQISEIAKTVRFLLSDDASGITAQVLCVDGGWSKNALPEDKYLN